MNDIGKLRQAVLNAFHNQPSGSHMLGVRLEPQLEAQRAAVATAFGRTKCGIAREAVRRHVRSHAEGYHAECRRPSLFAGGSPRTNDDEFWDGVALDAWHGDDAAIATAAETAAS